MPKVIAEDSNDDIARNLWRTARLIRPSHPARKRWDLLMFLFVIYNAIYLPVQLAFGIPQHLAHVAIDYVVDAAFWVDVVLNFRTTFVNEEGELCTSARVLRLQQRLDAVTGQLAQAKRLTATLPLALQALELRLE